MLSHEETVDAPLLVCKLLPGILAGFRSLEYLESTLDVSTSLASARSLTFSFWPFY